MKTLVRLEKVKSEERDSREVVAASDIFRAQVSGVCNLTIFMESHLPMFKEKNLQLEVVTELIRGQHPHLKGVYKNKSQRVICVKNMDPEDILLHATRLRNALGRKVVKLRTRHVTKHPSVQGTWTTAMKY
ncbi:hypothetical protein Fmac_010811 [Flemingia macrophylla]|uniref:Large ribosomal subunit protein mL43 n=1 Tax=Flemingia macrophylla TaxID=520843 RepID=A0ABD1MMR1_9FABA